MSGVVMVTWRDVMVTVVARWEGRGSGGVVVVLSKRAGRFR